MKLFGPLSLAEPLLEPFHKKGKASPHQAGASTPKRATGGGAEVERKGSSPVQAAVFGVINGVVGLPSLIAFAAIVFQVCWLGVRSFVWLGTVLFRSAMMSEQHASL